MQEETSVPGERGEAYAVQMQESSVASPTSGAACNHRWRPKIRYHDLDTISLSLALPVSYIHTQNAKCTYLTW